MEIWFWIKIYLLTIPLFFAIDILWLGLVARDFYRRELGPLLAPRVNWGAAVVFYLLYIVGILAFAVRPALTDGSLGSAAVLGGLFGFFTYATYDLTNLATLENWPPKVVVVDITWGVILCTTVASAAYFVAQTVR